MKGDNLLKPRLIGKRFDKHDIPMSVLKELSQIESIIYMAAKNAYLTENKRERVPSGFLKDFSVNMVDIKPGSAHVALRVYYDTKNYIPACTKEAEFVEKGMQNVLNWMSQASNTDCEIEGITKSDASMLSKFGKFLRQDEKIEFGEAGGADVVLFDCNSRMKFLKYSSNICILEDRNLTGIVAECDASRNTFTLKLISGESIDGIPVPKSHDDFDAITESLKSSKTLCPRKISIDCTVEINRQNKIQSVESIERLTLLESLDVPSRLEEFANLKSGWLDGCGDEFELEKLRELGLLFIENYPSECPLPYTYPDEKQSINFEWDHLIHSLTLNISLVTFNASWIDYDKEADELYEKEFYDFRKPETWKEFVGALMEVMSHE